MNALDVFLHTDRVGRLERLAGAELEFTYEPAWAGAGNIPLSLSLPLREKPFSNRECRPFFAGLLPEGDFLKAIARAFHISAENPFTVLAEIGGECAGAISLVAPGAEPPSVIAPPPEWLTETGLEQLLADLPSRPLLVGPGDEDEGVRLSLAGTRDKLPVLAKGDRIAITRGRPPSTHIIKKPAPALVGMVANEAFCLALAGIVGLPVAEARPIAFGEEEGLLVRRYDRIADEGTGEVRRIHQEDFCQVLSLLPAEKYQAEGGPSVASCGELIRRHSAAPGADLFIFLDSLFFNLVIGNADAHAKNFSLLLEGADSPRLAPLYDLLSTRVYGRRFGRKMAMKYGGEYKPDWIRGRHLDRVGADLGIASSRVRLRATEIADNVVASAEEVRRTLPEGWQDHDVIDGIIEIINMLADTLSRAATDSS
jgi:serine/threonine-protein kinase HipA